MKDHQLTLVWKIHRVQNNDSNNNGKKNSYMPSLDKKFRKLQLDDLNMITKKKLKDRNLISIKNSTK